MASDIKVAIAGLHTHPNPFSAQPPGALARADNTVLNAQNVLEPRRGFTTTSYGFGASGDRANNLHYYGSTLMVQYNTALTRDTGAAFSDYSGTYTPVDNTKARMRFINAAGNAYFNCSDGTRVLDTAAGTPTQAGVPKALRTFAFNASANGWQTANTAVAYRAVWGIVDAQGNEKLGAPSGRMVLRNHVSIAIGSLTRTAADGSHPAGKVTAVVNLNSPHYLNIGDTVTLTPGEANFAAGLKTIVTVPTPWSFTYNEAGANVSSTVVQEFQRTRSATVWVDTPPGITTSHFFQIYRSEMSATADTEPSDDLYLTYEGKPSAGDITAGFVEAADITQESFLGDAAPWNANGGYGLLQSNERPPVALDLEYWDDRLWYANTTSRHRFFLELLGVGSPSGAQALDTITIGGQVYTFSGGVNNVFLYTLGTPSENVTKTAQDLVEVINSNASSTVKAYYVSEGAPFGKILLEETAIGGALFAVSASRVASWNPALSKNSDSNTRPHGLMYSKQGEPEAVPITNEVLVGARNSELLRAKALKASLVAFKTDGIYTVTGRAPYNVEKISTARLLAPESVVSFSDRLWAFTDQGLTSVSEGAGVSVISYAVEGDLTALFGDVLSAVKRYSFSVGYESDRRLLAWMPTIAADTKGTQAYNYSTATKSFTRWTKYATCGLVNPNTDRLVIGSGTLNRVLTERKDYASTDYQDETFTATLSSISGNVLTFSTSAHGILAGDLVERGAASSIATLVDGAAVTVVSATGFTTGSATVYPGIDCRVTWQPITSGNPALTKMHRQVSFLFNGCTATLADATFSSELDSAVDTVDLTFTDSPAKVLRISPLPRDHAQSAQLSVGFNVREARTSFKLHGFVADLEADTERTGRR